MKKDTVKLIVNSLREMYPEPVCALNYSYPYEMLIAARLSAQCTDKRVNIVTKKLFKKYKTLEEFALADIEDIEQIIKPCGLFHVKAHDIVKMCDTLLSRFNGVVPSDIDELTSIPGVGRKTANLIRGDIYHLPAIVADTHCIRISNRLGLANSKNPLIVEKQLKGLIEDTDSNDFCHRLVLFGRDICKARNPKCGECPLCEYCREIIPK